MGYSGIEAAASSPFKRILYTEQQVDEAIGVMANTVVERCDPNTLMVCLLRGGAPFAHGLMRAIARQHPGFHPQLDYMRVRTYGDGQVAGEPTIITDLDPDVLVADRRVLLLDDTLDSGATAAKVRRELGGRGAICVETAVLIQKDRARSDDHPPADMYCLEGPDEWLVGMGLDDTRFGAEAFRWMGCIAVARPDAELEAMRAQAVMLG